MSWVMQEGLVRFCLSTRRGHALAVQLHGAELQKERSEQDSGAPRAHRRIFTIVRQTLQYNPAGRRDECAHQSLAPGTEHTEFGFNAEHGDGTGGKAVPVCL